ncbi:MAG: hypothetical protein Q9160_007713 [Pyrenula sp. 1 TL-2023]
MTSIIDSRTPSPESTPDWYEYRTSQENLEIGKLVKALEVTGGNKANIKHIKEAEKKIAEVSTSEKGKEKAVEWVEDLEEEGEKDDVVSALPTHTKVCVTLHVWRPPRMTSRVLAWVPHHKVIGVISNAHFNNAGTKVASENFIQTAPRKNDGLHVAF